jgi:biopolymer transport protein ExbD
MKFPRNARIIRGQLDAAPIAGVFFCLLIFLLLASLVYTPGVSIQLAAGGANLTGVDGPTVAVAMDANGWFYFENQAIPKNALLSRLRDAVRKSPQPLTLVVAQDKNVTWEKQAVLADMARAAGIKTILYEVRANQFDSSVGSHRP